MSDLNFQFHFVHRCDTGDFDIDVRLKIPRIFFIGNEGLHFIPEKLDVLKGGTKINIDRKLFSHSIRPRNVLDPHGIEYDIRYLCQFVGIDVLKYCKQQRDLFDNQLIITNVDPVEYIKGMLDE